MKSLPPAPGANADYATTIPLVPGAVLALRRAVRSRDAFGWTLCSDDGMGLEPIVLHVDVAAALMMAPAVYREILAATRVELALFDPNDRWDGSGSPRRAALPGRPARG